MTRLRFLVSPVAIVAGVLTIGCSPEDTGRPGEAASALGQQLGGETEPNGATGSATPITKDGVVRANVTPSGEDDYYSFAGVAGERIHAAVLTSFSSGGADSLLDLVAPDGTTVIESDNENGSLSPMSSSIAGATLTQNGTHYLRVRNATGSGIRPYDLHIKTMAGAPVPEAEPNSSAGAAQALPASGWAPSRLRPISTSTS
jgi:hypothetical protein